MSKILRKEKTTENTSHHVKMVAADIATQIATHAADDDAHHTVWAPTYGYEMLPMLPRAASFGNGFITANAADEGIQVYFYVDAHVSASADLTFYIFYNTDDNDATFAMKEYVQSTATDGSEAASWNITNGGAVNFDSTVAARTYKYTLTVDSADFVADDLIGFQYRWNQAGKLINFFGVGVRYTYA